MRRRDFITLVGRASVAWPLAAGAQQPTMPVIGYLGSGSPESESFRVTAVRQGLNEAGYVEGRNVAIEYRWAEDQRNRLPALVIDLVGQQVAVIVAAGGTASALAAKAATTTIPIVFGVGSDPVKLGLVASFNRPGGNVTGVTYLTNVLLEKQFEILYETLPRTALIGLLVNPTNPNAETDANAVQAAADTIGQKLLVVNASTERDFDTAFANLVQQRVGALIVESDQFFASRRDQIVTISTRHALPAVYDQRQWVAAGGLMSYGTNALELWRTVGVYTGRILKGEKPSDLPVVEPTKFQLVLNLKTAKELGLEIPMSILVRADEVIE